jgi:hypothetical protein
MKQSFSDLKKEAEAIIEKNIKRDIASVIPAEVTSGAKDGASGGTLSARPDQLNQQREIGSSVPPVLAPKEPLTSEPLPQKFENPLVGNEAKLSSDAQIVREKAEGHDEHLHNIHKSLRDINMKVIKKKTRTKMSEKTPEQAKKYDRCVEDLKGEKGVDSAYAICQTSVLGNTGSDTKKSSVKIEKAFDEFKKYHEIKGMKEAQDEYDNEIPEDKKRKKGKHRIEDEDPDSARDMDFDRGIEKSWERYKEEEKPFEHEDIREILIRHSIEPTQINMNQFKRLLDEQVIQNRNHPIDDEKMIHVIIDKLKEKEPQPITTPPVIKPEEPTTNVAQISSPFDKAWAEVKKEWKPYKEWKAEQDAKGGKKDDKEDKKPSKNKDKKKPIKKAMSDLETKKKEKNAPCKQCGSTKGRKYDMETKKTVCKSCGK